MRHLRSGFFETSLPRVSRQLQFERPPEDTPKDPFHSPHMFPPYMFPPSDMPTQMSNSDFEQQLVGFAACYLLLLGIIYLCRCMCSQTLLPPRGNRSVNAPHPIIRPIDETTPLTSRVNPQSSMRPNVIYSH